MMGGAVKRYEAAAYDERQPAPPRNTDLHKIKHNKQTVVMIFLFFSKNVYNYPPPCSF